MVKVAKEKLPEETKKTLEEEIARVEQRAGISLSNYFNYFNNGLQPAIEYSVCEDRICIGELG